MRSAAIPAPGRPAHDVAADAIRDAALGSGRSRSRRRSRRSARSRSRPSEARIEPSRTLQAPHARAGRTSRTARHRATAPLRTLTSATAAREDRPVHRVAAEVERHAVRADRERGPGASDDVGPQHGVGGDGVAAGQALAEARGVGRLSRRKAPRRARRVRARSCRTAKSVSLPLRGAPRGPRGPQSIMRPVRTPGAIRISPGPGPTSVACRGSSALAASSLGVAALRSRPSPAAAGLGRRRRTTHPQAAAERRGRAAAPRGDRQGAFAAIQRPPASCARPPCRSPTASATRIAADRLRAAATAGWPHPSPQPALARAAATTADARSGRPPPGRRRARQAIAAAIAEADRIDAGLRRYAASHPAANEIAPG